MERPILTGIVVTLLGLILLNLVPNIDPAYFDDGILTGRELIGIAGSILLGIAGGFVRFVFGKKSAE